ncbi:MAG: HAD family hydrolase [Candidatus Yanofskybacteria bacterium]|nr:HAD family hydrolase [Candidatus Yanofskybacteria bacterium]
MSKKEKVFLFDLDDTLMWNEYTYSLATIEFLQFLIRIFDRRLPFVGNICRRVEEISHQKVSQIDQKTGKFYGFSVNRFPDTLADCYKELCQNGWGKYEEEAADHVRRIGLKAFDPGLYQKDGYVKDSVLVLRFLREKNDVLILLTKGDPEVQALKVDGLGIKKWIPEVRIVSDKTKEIFQEYKERFSGQKIYSIGNSFSSDIKPALEAGISAIFIPCFTWKAESIDVDKMSQEQKKRFWEVKEIKEVVNIYPEL